MPRPLLRFSICCLSLVVCVSARAATWLKVSTGEIVVLSDASETDIVEYAVGYSAFRHTFRELFAPVAPLPPVTIVLFRRQPDFQKHGALSTMTAFATEVDGEALLAVSMSHGRRAALETTFESDTVWQLRRVGYSVPIWMSQGAGEVLSSLEVRDGVCVIGESNDSYAGPWEHVVSHLPWPEFFAINFESPEYHRPNGMFQAQAWALMRRILLEGESGRQRFQLLASKLRDSSSLDAVLSTLGIAEQDLERDIMADFRKRHRLNLPFDSAKLRASLHPVPASDAEVLVASSNLLLSKDKTSEARQELARAIALAPESAVVKEAQARQAFRDGNDRKGLQLYRDAIAAGSTHAAAYLISARQRLTDATSGVDREGDGGPDIDVAVCEVRKGLQLYPGSTEAYQLLGRALFLSPKVTLENAAELTPGVRLGAEGESIRYFRALLYARLGRQADCQADLRCILSDKEATVPLRRLARERLADVEYLNTAKQVEESVKAKEFEKARATIATALSGDMDRGTAQRYQDLGKWVAEAQDWDAVYAAFGRHRATEFQATAEKFLRDHPASRAAETARQMLNDSREWPSPSASN